MMKRFAVLLSVILLCSVVALAERPLSNTQSISVSGNTISLQNDIGGVTASFEEKIAGAPSTVNIVIKGCSLGGTCDTLDTYTTVADSIRKPTISTIYYKFTITASWTGGTSPVVTVNSLVTGCK